MISTNSDKVAKSIDELARQIELKLKNMVAGFAMEVAAKASNNTPIGNEADAQDEKSKYGLLYRQRRATYGIPVEVGFHKGAFVYSERALTASDFDRNINEVSLMLADIENMAESQYKVGDDFYVGAVGPAFGALEEGSSRQAPDGIMKPTIDSIKAANSADLQRHYKG